MGASFVKGGLEGWYEDIAMILPPLLIGQIPAGAEGNESFILHILEKVILSLGLLGESLLKHIKGGKEVDE
ncbi:unnamed protein product [Caretta caretta]